MEPESWSKEILGKYLGVRVPRRTLSDPPGERVSSFLPQQYLVVLLHQEILLHVHSPTGVERSWSQSPKTEDASSALTGK